MKEETVVLDNMTYHVKCPGPNNGKCLYNGFLNKLEKGELNNGDRELFMGLCLTEPKFCVNSPLFNFNELNEKRYEIANRILA